MKHKCILFITTLAVFSLCYVAVQAQTNTFFRFTLELKGSKIGFSDVTGLNLESDPIEYRRAIPTDNTTPKKTLPKKALMLIMKRGVAKNYTPIIKWISEGIMYVTRQDLSLTLNDETGNPIKAWVIRSALPMKLSKDSSANGDTIVIEYLEISCEGIDIIR